MTEQKDGWNEWAKRVLGDIERLEVSIDKILIEITNLRVDIAVLKTKSAIAGAFWGALVSLIVSIIAAIIVKQMGK